MRSVGDDDPSPVWHDAPNDVPGLYVYQYRICAWGSDTLCRHFSDNRLVFKGGVERIPYSAEP